MFPPTTMASYMAPFYPGAQPGVAVAGHGHGPQSHAPHPSPPAQKQSKSSKSRAAAASSHLGLPPGYPHYGGQHVGQQVGQVGRVGGTSGANQARPPNVTIPHLHAATAYNSQLQHYQYQAMLSNPALMYGQNYDQRSGMYPAGYGSYYHR